ncbi:4Fe-4S binding protein [Acetivibrio cellulolyticus]|uniref:4Fe-4S binding protein n=1 Tax=Acetivibrio cellulolyticus TaxID=35830 RepID=UPI0001E2D496|nr:4Fe-4S binding protein [Acetivibrio cellulolyticus]
MEKVIKFFHNWAWLMLVIYCVVGMFYPLIGTAALICMLAPSIVAVFKGRMWCGNFCPRGSFNDRILSKFSLRNKVPGLLKATWFRLTFLILLMGAFAIQIVFAWGNIYEVSFVFVRMIIITTVITIILGVSYNQRTWCMICPMGTMAHYIAKLKLFAGKFRYIAFNKEKCVNCKVCTKNCPIGIDVLSHKSEGTVNDADCLKCKVCIEKCPKKSLYVA